jgi:hypothetical protein
MPCAWRAVFFSTHYSFLTRAFKEMAGYHD